MSAGLHGSNGRVAVGVDIGGTKVLAGVVDARGRVLDRARADTPSPAEPPTSTEDVVVRLVERLRTTYDVSAVGVGAAGFVDAEGEVAFSPHLSWRDEPLRVQLSGRLGVTVVVDNDANVAALAELRLGAAQGRRDVVCVTLGTGIGGAVVLDGEVRRGARGFAGEFGHMAVEPDGRDCPCGQRGCWEQYCSGTALVRAAASAEEAPGGLTGLDVTRAAQAGEPWAASAYEEIGTWLGQGLAGVCAALDPELVVIGGGLVDAGDILLDPARAVLDKCLVGTGSRPIPPIVPAALGPEAGFIGAGLFAHQAVS